MTKRISDLQDSIQDTSLIASMYGSKMVEAVERCFKLGSFHTELRNVLDDSVTILKLAALLKRVEDTKIVNFSFVNLLNGVPAGYQVNVCDIAKEAILDEKFIIDISVKQIFSQDSDYTTYKLSKELPASNGIMFREDKNVNTGAVVETRKIEAGSIRFATSLYTYIPFDGKEYGIKLTLINPAGLLGYCGAKDITLSSLNNKPSDIDQSLATTLKTLSNEPIEDAISILTGWESQVYTKQMQFGSIQASLLEYEDVCKISLSRLLTSVVMPILYILRAKIDLATIGAEAELLGVNADLISSTKDIISIENYYSKIEQLMSEAAGGTGNKRSPVADFAIDSCNEFIRNMYPTLYSILKEVRA